MEEIMHNLVDTTMQATDSWTWMVGRNTCVYNGLWP